MPPKTIPCQKDRQHLICRKVHPYFHWMNSFATILSKFHWPSAMANTLKYLVRFYKRGKRGSYLVLAIAPGQWNLLKTFHFFANFGRKSIAQDLVTKLFVQWKWGDTCRKISYIWQRIFQKVLRSNCRKQSLNCFRINLIVGWSVPLGDDWCATKSS